MKAERRLSVWWTRFRDAVSGRFVSKPDAEARPEATVGERRRRAAAAAEAERRRKEPDVGS